MCTRYMSCAQGACAHKAESHDECTLYHEIRARENGLPEIRNRKLGVGSWRLEVRGWRVKSKECRLLTRGPILVYSESASRVHGPGPNLAFLVPPTGKRRELAAAIRYTAVVVGGAQ